MVLVSLLLLPKCDRGQSTQGQRVTKVFHFLGLQKGSEGGERFYGKDILHVSFLLPFVSCPAHPHTRNAPEGAFGAGKMDSHSSPQ